MEIERLFRDFGIEIAPEGNRHYRPGWINIVCPYCTGNPGYHLGFDKTQHYFFCWRCGWHPFLPTISTLLNLNTSETRGLIKKYDLSIDFTQHSKKRIKDRIINHSVHTFPSNTTKMLEPHKKYLESRNFDPEKLEVEWGLVGTGPISNLGNLSFARRIIIPIIWERMQVSFTSRDITNKHPIRYLTCPKDSEYIHHKFILYGNQKKWTNSIICVEGPTDVWRLGSMACATFGIKYTNYQISELSERFDNILVYFDDDPQAIQQAEKLVAELTFRGKRARKITLPGDPASLSQDDADYLVKQFIQNKI